VYLFAALDAGAEAEIDQLRRGVFIEDDVLQFYVAVCDAPLMQVFQCFCQFLQDFFCTVLRAGDARGLSEGCSEWRSGEVFHDDVDVVVGLYHIEDPDDVWVVDCLQDSYFSADCALALGLADFHLFVGLYSDASALGSKYRHSDRGVSALPNHFSHDIVSFEFCCEVALFSSEKVLFGCGRGQSSEHAIVFIFQLQKLDAGEIFSD